MATGIVSYGAYIPMYRLSHSMLSQVWGGGAKGGEKAVANWDEDSLTMAIEAIIDCSKGMDPKTIDGLYFATTTPAYREKQSASIIAKVMDLRRDIMAADITDSLRGGTIALRAALHAIDAGVAKNFMIAAADSRLPAPDSEFEPLLGDGSAALLLGNSNVAVEIEGSCSLNSEFMDIWKREKDAYIQTWEDRFVIEHGYLAHLKEIITELFKKYNMAPKDFNKAVFYAYDARRHVELAKKLGFSPEQVQDPLISTVGNTGAASTLMMLVAALEDSKPGDKILLANYGDGADAYILKVTDQIEKVRDRKGIKKNLASKMMLPNYGKYLHFRDMMKWQVGREPSKYASLTSSWRDRNWVLSGKGNRCKHCSGITFPPQRVCSWCQTKDEYEEVKLTDKKGILFTFSLDNLAVSIDPPTAIAIVDIEGGGRLSTILTDRDPDSLVPEMPVEFTFRRIHEGQGINNYFWKCRPVRG